jgi:DNA-binding MarR family transcriptional regulator
MPQGLEQQIAQAHFRFPALEAILSISVAAEHLRQQVDKAVAPLDINGGQYTILRVLKRAYPEALSRSDILKRMIEKTVDITRQIDGLEKKGLVERIRTREDRRLSLARITPQGMEVLEKIDPLFRQMLLKIAGAVSEEECRQISALCEKVYSVE